MRDVAVRLDRYARDPRPWRDLAVIDHAASSKLFESGNPLLIFAAATLGHHALEMYLKAALICEGMTVFDPRKVKRLVPKGSLSASDCAWGHDLVTLARQLAGKRPDFDLKAELSVPGYFFHKLPMTVEAGFALFDPFFSELRYPQELKKLEGVGEHEKIVLDALIQTLMPFLAKIP